MFYSMGAAVKIVLLRVEIPDPASYLFILLALHAIFSENDYLCAAALALAMFTKETLMVVIPLHYSLKAARFWDTARLKRSILVGAPAVCSVSACSSPCGTTMTITCARFLSSTRRSRRAM
jgi:hypothetical protein